MMGIHRAITGLILSLLCATTAAADTRCNVVATGGSVSLVTTGGQTYCMHQFTTAGTGTFTLLRSRNVEHLVIAGGGGAGTGGGGAGGMLSSDAPISRASGTYPVTIGGGGAGSLDLTGGNGGNSAIFGIIATGGGGGGNLIGQDGGSGGGGGRANGNSPRTAGTGITGQGFNGANAVAASGNDQGVGGGGGGAGGPPPGVVDGPRPNGGPGRINGITGSNVTYAGGGASRTQTSNGTNGLGQLTFGGGGQHSSAGSTAGRSGVVIVRYIANFPPTANAGPDATVTPGTVTTLNGNGSTDPENNITSYAWVQTAGTTVTLTGANTQQATFTALQPVSGQSLALTFRLTVTDAFGLVSTDTVTITVLGATAELAVTKTVSVFSEGGSGCSNLSALAPGVPALPAAIPGACITFVIRVENTGPVTAQAIVVTDPLPSTLIFQGAALGPNWGSGTVLSTPAIGCTAVNCIVSVSNGVIAAGQAATVTIRATIR